MGEVYSYIRKALAFLVYTKGKSRMKLEGQVRIPSGCAISAVISREGNKMSGEMITNSMKPMHDRSNGLGGGFAGYVTMKETQSTPPGQSQASTENSEN